MSWLSAAGRAWIADFSNGIEASLEARNALTFNAQQGQKAPCTLRQFLYRAAHSEKRRVCATLANPPAPHRRRGDLVGQTPEKPQLASAFGRSRSRDHDV